jgi:hypothetical protein
LENVMNHSRLSRILLSILLSPGATSGVIATSTGPALAGLNQNHNGPTARG